MDAARCGRDHRSALFCAPFSVRKAARFVFVSYLGGISGAPYKTWVNTNHGTQYITLPTFIRNKIDHPDARDANNKKYTFTEIELKTSIDWMLSLL